MRCWPVSEIARRADVRARHARREQRRRSIYFTVKRSELVPMMQVFDAPEALSSIGDRRQPRSPAGPALVEQPQRARTAPCSLPGGSCPLWDRSTAEAACARVTAIALGREPGGRRVEGLGRLLVDGPN